MKREIHKSTMIAGNFNTLFPVLDRTVDRKSLRLEYRSQDQL